MPACAPPSSALRSPATLSSAAASHPSRSRRLQSWCAAGAGASASPSATAPTTSA
eukprot:SM008551S23186  [mRNA]  locus=s8551:78:560:- [translate_table: standard]